MKAGSPGDFTHCSASGESMSLPFNLCVSAERAVLEEWPARTRQPPEWGLNVIHSSRGPNQLRNRLKLFAASHKASTYYSDGNAAEHRITFDAFF